MPGKPFSEEPAIEGPARMKAKARMKLIVRPRRFVGNLITVSCFRISAPKAENGFVAAEICFVGQKRRNIGDKTSMISVE